MATQMIVRLDEPLKAKVSALARKEGKSLSELVRELLENYARDRDISGFIDQLWNDIGRGLEQAGATQADVDRAIRQVRLRK